MADIGKVAYFRGAFVPFKDAHVSIASAPVLYGLSVYTVMPVFWDDKIETLNIFRLSDHFNRLQNSAKIMAFEDFLQSWDLHEFENNITQLLLKNNMQKDCLVRISIFVDDNLQGTRMHGLKQSLSAFVYCTPPLLPASGAQLMVSNWMRMPDNSIPARAKINGSYVNAALMKHEAVLNGFDDAISLDANGHVAESTVANIFLVKNDVLITPHDATDILEGITRDTIIEVANDLGFKTEKRAVDRSELYIADEIFLCGSSVQIAPAIEVDHRKIGDGRPGPVTLKLKKVYDEIGHNNSPKFKDWLTPVH